VPDVVDAAAQRQPVGLLGNDIGDDAGHHFPRGLAPDSCGNGINFDTQSCKSGNGQLDVAAGNFPSLLRDRIAHKSDRLTILHQEPAIGAGVQGKKKK